MTNTSATATLPSTPRTEDLHIVVAALDGIGTEGFIGYVAVSAPLTYDDALKVWEEHDKMLTYARRYRSDGHHDLPSSRKSVVGHVSNYAVRSMADPRFQPTVGQGFADQRSRTTGRRTGYSANTGRSKAAKAWAKMYGYVGREGGWIYDPSGTPVTQGWASFANLLRRRGVIAQGADGLWYVLDREVVA